MPEVLATFDDFSGGHWGNEGPSAAEGNQYGGINMILAEDGSLVPASSSRWLQLNANPVGKLWGAFWAWGGGGQYYFITSPAATTVTNTVFLYRYVPNPSSLPNTITTISTFQSLMRTDVAWVANRENIYFTVYGDRSYEIRGNVPDLLRIGNSPGQSPGGKCIAIYKDRIWVGNIYDARFGNKPNRIHFSGDESAADNIADGSLWLTDNYLDLGGVRNNEASPTIAVTCLLPMRDYMLAICDDQSIYVISGYPNLDLTVRRAYGFTKGSGGLTAFQPTHGAVDPSQVRAWMYDHSIRAPIRFNGASVTRLEQFGTPNNDRTGTAVVEGITEALAGPDEFLCEGVTVGRSAGAEPSSHRLLLLRVNGVYSLIANDVIAARS